MLPSSILLVSAQTGLPLADVAQKWLEEAAPAMTGVTDTRSRKVR
jgi:hypothetical protein